MNDVTDSDLRRLQAEAGAYGDEKTAQDAANALAGDGNARARCEAIIRYARRQVDWARCPTVEEGLRCSTPRDHYGPCGC